MQELLNKRTYNAKHFDKGDGSFVLEAHAGHIHYKDGEEFKPLDWTLIFDETKRGWGFNTHSFHPFFPEYSDGWAEFHDLFQDKDQIVKYKPIGARVKGELIPGDLYNPNFDDNDDNKGVIYRDVFGAGRDYILYNTRSSMVKVATVNNPNECTADAVFEWEVEFPDKELFRVDKKEDADDMTRLKTKTNTEDGKLVGYRLEKRDGKNVNTNKLTLIGNSKLDGKEWYTYLKSFKAWDSEGTTIDIVARISFVNGKAILKKTIPLEFLKNAVGKVFTDTTTSYYAESNSYLYSSGGKPNWAATDTTPCSSFYSSFTEQGLVTNDNEGGTYYCSRNSNQFDTSGIGSSSIITSAAIYWYQIGYRNDNGASLYVVPVVYPRTTSTSGWGDFTKTDYGNAAFSSGTATWKNISLNSTGLSNINKTGKTALGFMGSFDFSRSTPPGRNYLSYRYADYTGTTYDPYLSVTYSAGGTTWTPKIIIF